MANWKFDVTKVFNINPECFSPKPKVYSTFLDFKGKVADPPEDPRDRVANKKPQFQYDAYLPLVNVDKKGVAVRAGQHCAGPLMDHMGINASCRASFAFYNTKSEVDTLVEALHLANDLFG